MYRSEVNILMKRMTRDALHYLIKHIEIVSSVLSNHAQTMNLKRNIRLKSEAVSQERTFLDKYVTNTKDRGTIGIIIRVRVISITESALRKFD